MSGLALLAESVPVLVVLRPSDQARIALRGSTCLTACMFSLATIGYVATQYEETLPEEGSKESARCRVRNKAEVRTCRAS